MKRFKKENSYIIRVFDDLLKLLQERPTIIFTRKFLELPEKKEFRKEVNERFEKLESKVDEAKEKAESVERKFDNFLENEFKPFKKKTENDLAKIKGVQFIDDKERLDVLSLDTLVNCIQRYKYVRKICKIYTN